MSQHFQSVYNVPQIDISAIEVAQALYSSPGIKTASEMTVQANRMNAMCAMPAIKSITAATNAINFRSDEFSDCADEINSVEGDEELPSTDINDSGDENP